MDVSSFLASETGDSEEMFLNFNQFDSGIAFSGEYHLPSNIEQEEGSSVIVDHVGLSQVTCPNATVIEEETDNSNFFRMEQNLFDSIVIPSANKAYITAEALAQVSFPCCAPQSDCYVRIDELGLGQGNIETLYRDQSNQSISQRDYSERKCTVQTCPFQSGKLERSHDDVISSFIKDEKETEYFVKDPVCTSQHQLIQQQENLQSAELLFRSEKISENCFVSRASSTGYGKHDFWLSTQPQSSTVEGPFASNRKRISKRRSCINSSCLEMPSSLEDFEQWRLEINSFLKRQGLSRREFARLANIGKNTVGKYLSGNCKRVSKEIVYKILHAFHTLQNKDSTKKWSLPVSARNYTGRRLQMKEKEYLLCSQITNYSPFQTDWDRFNSTSFEELEKVEMEDTSFRYFSYLNDEPESEAVTWMDFFNSYSSHKCNVSPDASSEQRQTSEIELEMCNAMSKEGTTETRLFSSHPKGRIISEDIQHADSHTVENTGTEYFIKDYVLKDDSISFSVKMDEPRNLVTGAPFPIQQDHDSSNTRDRDKEIQDLVEQSYYLYSDPFRIPCSSVPIVPLQIHSHIPCDEADKERSVNALYPWRSEDNRQSVQLPAFESANNLQVPNEYKGDLQKPIQSALEQRGLINGCHTSKPFRVVHLNLDIGDDRHISEVFHVDYPWPENFPYVLARQICLDLDISLNYVERIVFSILQQLNKDS